MKFYLTFILLVLGLSTLCQSKGDSPDLRSDFSKWSKAIVNIECKGPVYAWFQILDYTVKNKFNNDKARFHSYTDSVEKLYNISSGTAIYVSDGDRRYLVTARHVVFDKVMTMQNAFNNHDTIKSNENLYECIFDISIKTPLDAALNGVRNNSSGWASANNNSKVYSLSSHSEDLAVISLQGMGYEGIRIALDQDGYVPIPINEIDTNANMKIGEEVYAIGYPFYSKVKRFTVQDLGTYYFQSPDIVLPVYVFGRVSMTHPSLNYFIADIDGYPGNSGGPIIRNDKIVGIVSNQIPLGLVTYSVLDSVKDIANNLYSRGNLMQIMKPSLMLKFLRILQVREIDKAHFY